LHDRSAEEDPELATAVAIARWMDRHYLDPLIGFVLPGAGDLIGASLGLYTLQLARRRGAPRIVLARMLLNLAVDPLFGAIPIAGDVGDVLFRAHTRNLELLREHLRAGVVRSSPWDWLVVAGAALAFTAALAVPIALLTWVVRALLGE
jgi:hypothetical protein